MEFPHFHLKLMKKTFKETFNYTLDGLSFRLCRSGIKEHNL